MQVLGDSAYASGDMLHTLDTKKWIPLLKPWPLRPAVEGGFTIDDFTYDAAANTLTCPGGVTRTVSAQGRATFKAACRGCPLRAQCTTSATGRTVLLNDHHQLQREHRKRAADEDFQAAYRQHRPMVERSIAWLTRGNRRVPYRGVLNNDAWLHLRAAAINLRRLLTLGQRSPPRALPRDREEQQLAPPPRRRPQPATTPRDGPDHPKRDLGPGLTGRCKGLVPTETAAQDGLRRAERPRCRTQSADLNMPLDGPLVAFRPPLTSSLLPRSALVQQTPRACLLKNAALGRDC